MALPLRSAAFDVVYDEGSDSFVFTVRGYGHGCGMSQFGAIGYASNGWSYADILAHSLPGHQPGYLLTEPVSSRKRQRKRQPPRGSASCGGCIFFAKEEKMFTECSERMLENRESAANL